jgi:hypothetical protein
MTSHGRHIGFQDGRHEAHHETFFCHNFGSITYTNIIQVAIPSFLGPANQMVPLAMTSHGCHVGFQNGPYEVHSKTVFCHNFGSIKHNESGYASGFSVRGQLNGAIGDDVTWTPYWISRWLP